MDCPSDVTLRSLLGEVSQKTSSTEVISHLASCNGCQQRIAAWEQSPRLNEVLSAANNNGIICQLPEPDPAGGSDALTNAYGLTPLRVIGQYELLRFIGQGGGGEVFEARRADSVSSAVQCCNKRNHQ